MPFSMSSQRAFANISFPFFQILFLLVPRHIISLRINCSSTARGLFSTLHEQRRRLDALLGHFVSFPLARSDFRVRRRSRLPATRATTATLATRPITATSHYSHSGHSSHSGDQAGKDRSPPPDILARCSSREARRAFAG